MSSGRGPGAQRRLALACLLALLVAAAPVRSQDRQIRTTVEPQAAPPELEMRDGAIVLSRDQAMEIALRRNLGLVVERYNRTLSALSVYRELGIYDLLARARAAASDNQQAITNRFQAPRSRQRSLDLGLTQNLPTGGAVLFDLTNSRTESNSQLNLTNLFYTSDATFTFVQPLLRNFGRLATERALLVARTNSQISRQEFERQAIDILRQVDAAYWNLVEAREQVRVAEESLSLARELHQRNRVQVDVGTMAPLELVQSEAQIAARDLDLIGAQASVADAADELRRLLNFPPGELWERPIVATTDPQTEHITVDVNQSIASALAARPELRSQELAIENARIEQAFARNQGRPQLDLQVTYGGNGTGSAYSNAFEQVRQIEFPSWTTALVFSFPIQNRAARAQNVIADLDLGRTQVELDQLQTVIRTEVRQAARGVDTAAKQIEAAKASRILQERNLEAERKRYENGMSSSFQITRIQDDLSQARSQEVSAIVNYRRALTEYYRATGRLLTQEGVTLVDEEPPVDRFGFSPQIESYGKQ